MTVLIQKAIITIMVLKILIASLFRKVIMAISIIHALKKGCLYLYIIYYL